MRASTVDVDFGDPDVYRYGVPHEIFAELRRTQPVAWIQEPPSSGFGGGRGFWAVTKHADVMLVSKNPQIFSSHLGSVDLRDVSAQELMMFRQMMVNIDPPVHTRMRKIISAAFTPKMVNGMLVSVSAHAESIVAGLEPDTEIDFVEKVAADMPLRVLADILGVPSADRWRLYDWTNRLVALGDEEYGGRDGFVSAFFEMFSYAAERTKERRATPTGDIWSTIVNAEIDGEQLSSTELDRFFQLLVIAGNETTRNMISGAVRVLDQHPDQWQQLRDDPTLIPSAIEEAMRFRSPVMQFRRTATQNTELGGQHIAAGDKVVVFYVSANRDEDVFEDPNKFDIRRMPNNHLAFGVGAHFCLGSNLARMEGRVLFEHLFKRFPQMRVTGEPERFRSNFINGIAKLPVALGPACD
jgi:cytochrome P450